MILANLTPTECYPRVTIVNGASLSDTIDTVDSTLAGFIFPAAWTAAGISLQGSIDNASFFPIFGNAAATQLVIVPAADVVVSTMCLLGAIAGLSGFDQLPRYLKIRSGTDAAPVAQGALRTITVILHPKHPPVI